MIDNVSQLSDAQKDPNALRERNLVDLEDPDANLSQEEREAIVCETISFFSSEVSIRFEVQARAVSNRHFCIGPSPSVEVGFTPSSLVEPALSHFVPR
jgi:hypothetical protein